MAAPGWFYARPALLRSGSGLTLAALLVSGLFACSAGESNVARGNREGILYYGNGTEPQTIDPHVLSGSPEVAVASAVLEPLLTRNPYTLAIEPGVAERWEFNEDRTTLTFHLNPAARWSNGDPVTAEDFRWSWQRALSPQMGNVMADTFFFIRGAEDFHEGRNDDPASLGVHALDDTTLLVELAYPNPYALIVLSYIYTAPVHRPTIEAHGDMTSRYSGWTKPGSFVGNGPFTIDDWKMQRLVSVTKNPYYWDRENVALNGIVFRPIENSNTEEKMFRSGQLHATTSIAVTKVPSYRQQPAKPLVEGPFMGTYYYMINTKRPPLDRLPLRRALALAIDRKTLAQAVLADTAVASSSYVPLGMPGYAHTDVLDFNPQEARRLLAEAGFPNGAGFPELTLVYNTLDNHRTIAIAVQQMWKSHLNIEVTIANQEWRVYLDTLNNRDYDLARMGWTGDTYPGVFLDKLVSGGGTNRVGFSNVEYDDIILNKVRGTGDEAQLMALYQEAEQVLLGETPLIPIYTYKNKFLAQPSLRGMPSNLASTINWKYIVLDPEAPAWRWQSAEP